jgi:hypothetical protein
MAISADFLVAMDILGTTPRIKGPALAPCCTVFRAMKATRHVTVLLSQDQVGARPGDGYEPLSGYVKAIEFTVEATSPLAACEVAYTITNSFPDELHCEARYYDVVLAYREIGHFRSVGVDDILEVDGERFTCARFGFAPARQD